MDFSVNIEGLSDLAAALGQFRKSTQRSILERTLRETVGNPIRDAAKAMAPKLTGELRKSIKVVVPPRSSPGKDAFAAAMRAGASREEAGEAAHAANATAVGDAATARIQVQAQSPHAHFIEFGTYKMHAEPFMTPAARAQRQPAIAALRAELGRQIKATAARVAKRKAKP
jgi:HK97 gp10 family phage protein